MRLCGSLRRWRRGSTLVEAVVATATFGLMVGGVVAVSGSAGKEWRTGVATLKADNNASLALQLIGRDVRNGIRASTSSGSLYVVMPYINSQGDYERYQDGATIRYYVDTTNKRLMRQSGTNTAAVLARNVTGSAFSVTGTQVSLSITATQSAGATTKTATLTSQASLRNDTND